MADWTQRSEKKGKYRKYQGIKQKRGMPFVSAMFQQFAEVGRTETCWWFFFFLIEKMQFWDTEAGTATMERTYLPGKTL